MDYGIEEKEDNKCSRITKNILLQTEEIGKEIKQNIAGLKEVTKNQRCQKEMILLEKEKSYKTTHTGDRITRV